MPQAIVVGVAAIGGWGTVATIAISVASMAYSYSMAKKAKNAAQGSNPAERKQILRSSSAPKNYIYGKVRSSGVLTFAQEDSGATADDEVVHLVITHAGHKIDWAGDVLLNDEPSSNYSGYVTIEHHNEGLTVADPYLVSNCPDWSDKMIGKDFAWMRIALKFNQEKFPTGIPNINTLKRGFKVDNLLTGNTEWSDNPALCILHFLRLKGWEDEYLILDTFKESARICNETVTNDDGTSEKRYTIGCEFDDSDTPASVLEKMMATCGGEWVRVGGRLGLRVAAYYGPAFIDITEDEIISGIEIQPEVDRSDSFNIVRGTFVSPEQSYTEIDYPEVKVAQWVTDDQEEIVMDMDLNYVQSPWQAQRLADIALKRSRLGMTMKLPCNMRAFQATPGTMINLSLKTIGFNREEFMVVDWDFSIDGGVNLIVRRDMVSFYDDAVGKPIVAPPIINLPAGGVAAPTNPIYSANAVGDIVQGVVSWTNSAFQIAHTNVIVKDNAGFIIQSAQVPFPGNDMNLNGKLAGVYKIELQAVGVNGRPSTATKMDITISAPDTPDTVSIKASNWSIHLIPSYNLGTTPFGTLFEFYASTTSSSTPPTRNPDEVASSWNQGGLAPDTNYYYWIRAVNSYGKSGWTQKTARTTKESDLVETLVERLVAVEIVSSNYVQGVSGYKIYGPQDPAKDGTAEFNDLIARGDIYAKSLTFLPGSTIPPEVDNNQVTTDSIGAETPQGAQNKANAAESAAKAASDPKGSASTAEQNANTWTENRIYPDQSALTIKSGNYVQGMQGWAIDYSGNAELNNVVVRGTGYFTDGDFKGTVYADKIIGDVVSAKAYPNRLSDVDQAWTDICTIKAKNNTGQDATVSISCPTFTGKSVASDLPGSRSMYSIRVLKDGSQIAFSDFEKSMWFTGTSINSTISDAYTLGVVSDSLMASDTNTHTYVIQAKRINMIGGPAPSLICNSAETVAQLFRDGSAFT